jgi:hypothetical protein
MPSGGPVFDVVEGRAMSAKLTSLHCLDGPFHHAQLEYQYYRPAES